MRVETWDITATLKEKKISSKPTMGPLLPPYLDTPCLTRRSLTANRSPSLRGDSTNFTTLFGGTESLENFWRNLSTMR